MDELGAKSPWFTREQIDLLKAQTSLAHWDQPIEELSDDFTRCPNCGHCLETPNY